MTDPWTTPRMNSWGFRALAGSAMKRVNPTMRLLLRTIGEPRMSTCPRILCISWRPCMRFWVVMVLVALGLEPGHEMST